MMTRLIYAAVLHVFFVMPVLAQNASVQDCLGAIPVCQEVYLESQAPIGFGNYIDLNSGFSCIMDETNSIWYTFTVNNSGKFGFLLTPNDPTMDYDWALFDITDADCSALFTTPELLVSCNAAGSDGCQGLTGANGDSEFNLQGANCGTFPPTQTEGFTPFNDLIDVDSGNTYVLVILNFTGSNAGYTLDFGLSEDIGIFDQEAPEIAEVGPGENCDGSQLSIQFSEYIQCQTIQEGNFELTGPGGPFTVQLSNENCDIGGNFGKSFQLDITPPLSTSETYNLNLITDGTTQVLDLCDNPAAVQTLSVALNPSSDPVVELGADTTLCPGNELLLDAGPDGDTYLWQNGSGETTLLVTTAGTYSVTVTTACGGLTEDVINVQFSGQAPDVDIGPDTTLCSGQGLLLDATTAGATYQWQDGSTAATFQVSAAGTYSVTVTTECGTSEDVINVQYSDQAPGVDIGPDTTLCSGQELLLDATTAGATYQWQDGSTAATFQVDAAGTYSVTVTTECGTSEDVINVQYSDQLPGVDIGPDTTLCSGQELLLDATTAGATYQWQDGSTASTFQVSTAGTYSVTVTTECGTSEDVINVQYSDQAPGVDIGPDTTLCSGQELLLDATTAGATYQWQDGSTAATFQVSAAGTYSVTVTTECGMATDEIQVGVLPALDINLADTSICSGQSITWDLFREGASYLWQDGSTSPSFTVTSAGTYSVTVTNSCESIERSATVLGADSIPVFSLGQDTIICDDQPLRLTPGISSGNFIWQDGSTDASYTVTGAGTYTLTATNACNSQSASRTVDYFSVPEITLGPDTTLCGNAELNLDVFSTGATYEWQDGSDQPTLTVNSAGVYAVTVTNACGEASDILEIFPCEQCEVFVPNAFSPNGDGINDRFMAFSDCPMANFSLDVFDRWGNHIFSSSSSDMGWNGDFKNAKVGPGVYIYRLRFMLEENGRQQAVDRLGEVLLIQ